MKTIRQFGLFIGFELNEEALATCEPLKTSGRPASIYVARQLLDAGLMTVPAGPSVVRWLPPLNITQADAAEALRIMQAVLGQIAGS